MIETRKSYENSEGLLLADFAMPLSVAKRQLNDNFETFIFMLICKK